MMLSRNKLFFIVVAVFMQLRAIPPSLQNCGNTCFFNASLQAFYSMKELVKLFSTYEKLYNDQHNPVGFYLSKTLREIDTMTMGGTRSAHISCDQTKPLRDITYTTFNLKCGNQHDAAEFFGRVIQELAPPGTTKKATPWAVNQIKALLFSTTVDINSVTKIDIQEGKYIPLFKQIEALGEGLLYLDPYQRTHGAPEYFMVTLKREGDQQQKKLDPVYVPLQINLQRFFFGSHDLTELHYVTNCHYELHAVVIHQGTTVRGGHYFAYVQSDGQWYKCDDDRITQVNITDKEVVKDIEGNPNGRTGYFFLYKKIIISDKDFVLWEEAEEARGGNKKKTADPLENALKQLTGALQNLAKALTRS